MEQNTTNNAHIDPVVKNVDANFFTHTNKVMNMVQSGFFLCQQGTLTIADNKSYYEMHPGDIYLYSPGTSLFVKLWSDDVKGLLAITGLDFITPVLSQITDTSRVLEILSNPCISLTDQQIRKIEEIADILVERFEEQASPLQHLLRKSLAAALCYEISIALYSNKTKKPAPANRQDIIFLNFMFSLKQNLSEHRDVAFYANEQCITPKHFSTVIKQRFGMSAGEWINMAIMSKAKELLLNTQISVKEIGFKLGFPNQSSFGRFFKQHEGISPYKFRSNSMNE